MRSTHTGLREYPANRLNGFAMLAAIFAGYGASALLIWLAVETSREGPGPLFFAAMGLILLTSLLCPGLYTVQPNEARVLVVFGSYAGSARDAGFWWSNPFAVKHRVSLRVRNFNSERAKVNDATGNPIEIAAVVTWRVTDSARALLEVDQYEKFVNVQAETAIRALASSYPYDAHDSQASLRGSPEDVARNLRAELHGRLDVAGVEVLDARISHLAYAPEIAQAMLRRQQAQAIIAARTQIVEGAVSMVDMALRRLGEMGVVELDEERKANMVSNLMVVLVSESETQPIINAGTLY